MSQIGNKAAEIKPADHLLRNLWRYVDQRKAIEKPKQQITASITILCRLTLCCSLIVLNMLVEALYNTIDASAKVYLVEL